jgi:uncharacterized protein (DUF433 family)
MMGGRACIRGMRIPVSIIVGQVAHGATHQQILADMDVSPRDRRVEDGRHRVRHLPP